MCWKVTFIHHFDNNFSTVRNFWTRPECFTKHTFRVWIWTQTFYFFDWNRDFYRPLNMTHRDTRNTGSTEYDPRGLNVLESTHSEVEYEHKFHMFSIEIVRVIFLWICPTEIPEIRIPVMCRWRGVKIAV